MMEGRDRDDQYRVSVEWLYDMDDYNEWMYEEDYEVIINHIFNRMSTVCLYILLPFFKFFSITFFKPIYFSRMGGLTVVAK